MVDIPIVFFIYSNFFYHFLIKCLAEIFRRKRVEERMKKLVTKKLKEKYFEIKIEEKTFSSKNKKFGDPKKEKKNPTVGTADPPRATGAARIRCRLPVARLSPAPPPPPHRAPQHRCIPTAAPLHRRGPAQARCFAGGRQEMRHGGGGRPRHGHRRRRNGGARGRRKGDGERHRVGRKRGVLSRAGPPRRLRPARRASPPAARHGALEGRREGKKGERERGRGRGKENRNGRD